MKKNELWLHSAMRMNLTNIMSKKRSQIWKDTYWITLFGGLVTKLGLTLVTPWAVAHQAPLSMGFSRQEYWSGLPFPSWGDLPNPGIEFQSLAWQADSLLTKLPGKLHVSLSVQFSSVVAQSCPTLCDPMNPSTPGLPVHHQLPEFTQTPVHWVSDAIQPSHPLLSPSSPAPNPSLHQSLFQWVNSSHEGAKVLEFQL